MVASWRACLDGLTERQQWELALKVGVGVFQGRLHLLADVPESQEGRAEAVRPLLCKITLSYISYKPALALPELELVFQVLTMTRSEDFLLGTVYPLMVGRGQEAFFMRVLRGCLLRQEMAYLTSEVLSRLVESGDELVI